MTQPSNTTLGAYGMGARIAAIRKRKGWTQGNLAEHMEVSVQAVSKWETGAAWPDITTIPRLASLLGVSADWLLGMTQETPDAERVLAEPEPLEEEGTEEETEPDAPAPEPTAQEPPAAPAETEDDPEYFSVISPQGWTQDTAPLRSAPTPEPSATDPLPQGTAQPTSREGISLNVQLKRVLDVCVKSGTDETWTWDLDGSTDLPEGLVVSARGPHLEVIEEKAGSLFTGIRRLATLGGTLNLYAPTGTIEFFRLDARGTGDIDIDPPIQSTDIRLRGAGDLKLSRVEHLIAEVAGAGDVFVESVYGSDVRCQGAGDVHYQEAHGNHDIQLSGAGDLVIASGHIQYFKLRQRGAGDTDIRAVEIDEADLHASGVGDVETGRIHHYIQRRADGLSDIN